MIVTALLGFPTDHSMSPVLFQIYASAHKIEYSHIKLNIEASDLKSVIKCLPKLGFSGVNITLPYKMDVIPFLDNLSPEIHDIGAVNTITIVDKKLTGYNTDMYGAIRTIEEALNREMSSQDTVVIFGTGGASRALIVGALRKAAGVTVIYREPDSLKTVSLKNDFQSKVTFVPVKLAVDVRNTLNSATIICNATSVGMTPVIEASPLSALQFDQIENVENKLFFDVIFNPSKTTFLSLAESSGARIAGGINMMVYQGVKAFELWTGKQVSQESIDEAKKTLVKLL